MSTKALVIIDIQNDITKHYRDIVDNINAAVDWAVSEGMHVAYIKHNNITAGTRTFKPGTRGEELVPELKVVSDNIFVKTKSNALTSEAFCSFIAEKGITEFYIVGADATGCVKSTCFNMRKTGYTVHVFSDCVTSYDLKKLPEMLAYYKKQGCELKKIMMPLEVQPRFKFNTVGLFTNDNKATVEFYTKAFGFTTSWDGVQPNVEMFLGDNRIILFPRYAFEQMVSKKFQYSEGYNGTMELSLDVPTFSDVDKEYQNALNCGAKSVLPPTTEPWGQRTCYVADPDGNLIEIGSFVEK